MPSSRSSCADEPSRARFLRLAALGGLAAVGVTGVEATAPALLPGARAALAATARQARPVVARTPAAHTWTNVFTDDFAGPDLDPRWSVYTGKSGTSYGFYNPDHVLVQGGNLVIYGSTNQVGGVGLFGTGAPQLRFAQIVFRQRTIKIGLDDVTPTFADVSLMWPLGNDRVNSPELDVRETSHLSLDPVQQSFHYATGNGGDVEQSTWIDGGAWHEYTVEVAPDGVTYRVDGRITLASTDPGVVPAGPMWFGSQVENSWKDTTIPPHGGYWIQQTSRVSVNAFVS